MSSFLVTVVGQLVSLVALAGLLGLPALAVTVGETAPPAHDT